MDDQGSISDKDSEGIFSSSSPRQDRLGGPESLLCNDYRDVFPEG